MMPDPDHSKDAPVDRRRRTVTLFVAALVAVVAIAGWMIISRTRVVEVAPENPPAPSASEGEILDRWAEDWASRVRDQGFFHRPKYDKEQVLAELVTLLKARGEMIFFRDHDAYELLSPDSSSNEIARTPAIQALFVEAARDKIDDLGSFEPTLLLRDVNSEGAFVPLDENGVPESLAKYVPHPSKDDRLTVVTMRRRVRERLDDLAEIARAVAKHSQTPTNFDRYPVLSWIWSLDLEGLEDSERATGPGTLPFFALIDLTAAQRVAKSWPSQEIVQALSRDEKQSVEISPFDAFDQAPRWVADSLAKLKIALDLEIQSITGDRSPSANGFEALRIVVNDFCNHEEDRELRVNLPDWGIIPPLDDSSHP